MANAPLPYTRTATDSGVYLEHPRELRIENFQCPWCWEFINLPVDTSAGTHQLTEDCPVCCQPIELRVSFDATSGDSQIAVDRENGF